MSYESWRISYQSSEAAARAAYATTEKLHAELTALRDQLAAVGAGGVEPLRKPAAAPQAVQVIKANCYSDDNGDYWRDCPDDCDFVDGLKVGDTYELQASIRAWSETFRVTKAPDETSDDYEVELVSTDAPLAATQPAAQGMDAETRRHAAIGKAIERACADLPEETEIVVSLEKDAGTVTLIDQDGNEHESFSTDYGFAGVMNEAIDAALAAQAKHEVQP